VCCDESALIVITHRIYNLTSSFRLNCSEGSAHIHLNYKQHNVCVFVQINPGNSDNLLWTCGLPSLFHDSMISWPRYVQMNVIT
jgi:hypothetical protein